MAGRIVLLLALALLVAAPALAAGRGLGDQKASVDAKLSSLQGRIEASKRKASALSSEVAGLTSRIKTLEGRVGDVSSRLSALQSDLALRQRRLGKLNELYRLQTVRLRYLKHEYALSVKRLNQRLVAIYKQNDPTAIDVLLTAKSFQDVLDQLDYLGAIANQDKHVATAVARAKTEVKVARRTTASVRQGVASEARAISARVQQQAILRGELLATRGRLSGALTTKAHALTATKAQIDAEVAESKALADASAQLEARIRAAASAPPPSSGGATTAESTPPPSSSSGLAWPASGPITSPFGMRWGTLHPGLDIGAPYGSAIHAAAAGSVIYCGWMSGYGNLVMIDHGGGISTAYGHQSRIAVSCGQHVDQGTTIGYVGSTGFSTGPHLHFEVRVNGSPVDPLGYLH